MARHIAFIVIIFLTQVVAGQKNKVDSLNALLANEKNELKKVSILIKLCEYCELRDNLKYATSTVNLINELKKNTTDTSTYNQLLAHEASAYSTIGVYYGEDNFYNNNNNYNSEKSILYYNKSIDLYKKINQWNKIDEVIDQLESQYLRQGDLYMILQTFKNAVDIGKVSDNKIFMARYIYRTAEFYARIGDTAKAMQYAEEGVALEKKINDPKRLAKGYELGGDLYYKIKQYQKAIQYYNKALLECEKNETYKNQPFIYYGLGRTYAALNNYEDAHANLKHALSLTDSLTNTNAFFTEIKIELGRLEYQFKNYTSAVYYHKYTLNKSETMGFPGGIAVSAHELAKDLFQLKKLDEAKKYAEQSLVIKKRITSVEQIMRTEELCFKIDSALGNYKSSLIHYMAFTQLQSKINIEEVKKSTIKDDLQNRFAREKEKEKIEQQKREAETAAEIKRQKYIRNSLFIGFIFLCLLAIVILRSYLLKKKQSKELLLKNNTILEQKHVIEEKQNEIIDSITYAKRLQQAILPPQQFISQSISDNFILYKPKDIVAGDFYWAEKIDTSFLIAAADSTGHGVPGAMVSVVCSNALNRSVKEFGLKDPGKILDKTRELVIETFEKSNTDVKDGMDISLLCIDTSHQKVYWSGANNPLWYVQDNELKEIKADKQPIGKTDDPKPFTTHLIDHKKNTVFYLFTDGLADQFGGPKGKKFKYKQFEELILSLNNLPMQKQVDSINKKFENWKGTLEQVDDVCVIGIKI